MKHIFYFIGILYILYEIIWIVNPKRGAENYRKFKTLFKEDKGVKWTEFSQDYKNNLLFIGFPGYLFSIWLFVGLFTFNWPIFLIFLIFNLAVIAPIDKLLNFSPAYIFLHWCYSILGLAFGVFVITNSYFLKINLYEIIKGYIF